jgi:hypothetical protein
MAMGQDSDELLYCSSERSDMLHVTYLLSRVYVIKIRLKNNNNNNNNISGWYLLLSIIYFTSREPSLCG